MNAPRRGPIPAIHTRRCVSLLSAGIVAALSFNAVADESTDQEDDVDNIVVTGTRTSNDLNEIPSTISVISLEDIEAQSPTTVTDALQDLPGVHVVQPSGQGGVSKVFVRGGDQEFTMILVDGVRVNDNLDTRGSAFDFSTLNMSDIERIEFVRGPHSAVYGSDSLSGVINIITKNTFDEFGGSVFAEAGSDDFIRGALNLSGPMGENNGFSVRVASKDDGEPVDGTTFEAESFSGRLYFSGDNWETRIFSNYTESDGTAFPVDSGGDRLAVLPDLDTRSAEDLKVGLNGTVSLGDKWRIGFLATTYDHDSSYLSPGIAEGVRGAVPANGADSTLKRTDYAVNAIVDVSDAITATFGVDHYDEEADSTGFLELFPGFILPADFAIDRDVTGAFGELHYKSGRGLTLLASIRRDDASERGAETTSRVGLIHEFNSGQTNIRANWGQGFGLPGFFALASPLVGNPDLLPQQSESMDLGITHWSKDGRFGTTLTLFQNEFDDMIDFDATTFQMVNRDQLETDGVELQFSYKLDEHLLFQAHATFLDMDLRGSDQKILQRPDWRGGLSVQWTPNDAWLIDASWLSIGDTYDNSVPTGLMQLSGYNRVDVTATWRVSDKLSLLLSADNLLDEEYEQMIGFSSRGVRPRLALRYLF